MLCRHGKMSENRLVRDKDRSPCMTQTTGISAGAGSCGSLSSSCCSRESATGGYTYRAHRKYDRWTPRTAREILDERYARGEITREQFGQLKADIAA
jgi:hypothetical protein